MSEIIRVKIKPGAVCEDDGITFHWPGDDSHKVRPELQDAIFEAHPSMFYGGWLCCIPPYRSNFYIHVESIDGCQIVSITSEAT